MGDDEADAISIDYQQRGRESSAEIRTLVLTCNAEAGFHKPLTRLIMSGPERYAGDSRR
jgi:hypothetical protein